VPGSVKRAAAVLAGVALGMLIAAGASPWRELFRKMEPVRPAPIQRERAPDTRV
jgi:hypothetical protein